LRLPPQPGPRGLPRLSGGPACLDFGIAGILCYLTLITLLLCLFHTPSTKLPFLDFVGGLFGVEKNPQINVGISYQLKIIFFLDRQIFEFLLTIQFLLIEKDSEKNEFLKSLNDKFIFY
jgi:hypothetical protein